VYGSSPRHRFASLHPTSNKAFVDLWVGNEKEAYLHYIYCKSQKLDLGRKQVIQSNQDVHVCGYVDGRGRCMKDSLFYVISLSFEII
jgi:hypothetical protein